MSVALVTDSTAYLPADLVATHDIRVVALHVIVAGTSYSEGVDISADDVAAALRRFAPVTTSRPTPAAFLQAYEEAAAGGADAVVSVHLSADLSGTIDAARLAAGQSPVPVDVVDSRVMGMAMGYAVCAAAEAAAAGAEADAVADVARSRAEAATALFYVDTLEHLRRGGRIGAASALLGSALAIKPLLALRDGRIEPVEKVRTSSRALARLEELAVAATAGVAQVDVAVHHLDSRERAETLASRLGDRLGDALAGGQVRLVELGAVVGVHVGPGTIAVVVSPRPDPDAPATGAGPSEVPPVVETAAVILLPAVAAFFIGGVNPATIIARVLRGDLRQGSGNPGATNAGRVLGVKWGVVVGVLDVLKGFLPTLVSLWLFGRYTAYAVGLACVLGHILSPYLKGRGGKGVATSLGAVLAVFPWLALAMVAVFVLLVWWFRWVAGASVVAALMLGLYAAFWPIPPPVLAGRIWGISLSVLVLVRHRANLIGWLRARRS